MALSPVYSTRFFAVEGLLGTQTYTPEAGFVAIVRDIDLYVAVPLLGSISFFFIGSSGQTIDYYEAGADTTATHQWRGRQVFTDLDTFSITVNSSAADVTVSGYLLTPP